MGGGHSSHEDHEQGKEHVHKPGENVEVKDLLGHGEQEHQTTTTNHEGHSKDIDSHNHDEHESLVHVII